MQDRKDYFKAYYRQHKEKIKQRAAEYREKNPDYMKKYREEHIDEYREYQANYRKK